MRSMAPIAIVAALGGCGGSPAPEPAPSPSEPIKPYYAVLYFGVDTIRNDALDANNNYVYYGAVNGGNYQLWNLN